MFEGIPPLEPSQGNGAGQLHRFGLWRSAEHVQRAAGWSALTGDPTSVAGFQFPVAKIAKQETSATCLQLRLGRQRRQRHHEGHPPRSRRGWLCVDGGLRRRREQRCADGAGEAEGVTWQRRNDQTPPNCEPFWAPMIGQGGLVDVIPAESQQQRVPNENNISQADVPTVTNSGLPQLDLDLRSKNPSIKEGLLVSGRINKSRSKLHPATSFSFSATDSIGKSKAGLLPPGNPVL